MIDLTGKTVVVTGGGSGIGRAVCQLFGEVGASVAVTDRNLEGAQETVETITAAGGAAKAYETDVTDELGVLQLRDDVIKDLGVPSAIVNNAGWDVAMPFVDTDREFWHKVVMINYIGTVAVTHAFLPAMIEQRGGSVINIASDAARVGSMHEAVYSGAKGGVLAFGKSLAREVARHEITVNAVCPGPTDTPLFATMSDRVRNGVAGAVPFKRVGQPEEIASAVVFFASARARFITGQTLSVSGGLTMAG